MYCPILLTFGKLVHLNEENRDVECSQIFFQNLSSFEMLPRELLSLPVVKPVVDCQVGKLYYLAAAVRFSNLISSLQLSQVQSEKVTQQSLKSSPV